MTRRDLAVEDLPPLPLERFLTTRLVRKDTFVCKSVRGCGGSGNRCRIDRIQTRVEGSSQSAGQIAGLDRPLCPSQMNELPTVAAGLAMLSKHLVGCATAAATTESLSEPLRRAG